MTGKRRFAWKYLGMMVVMTSIVGLTTAPAEARLRHDRSRHHRRQDDWWEHRTKIRQRARSQTGAPYRYGGSSPGGFDCSGFTKWTYSKYKDLPHSSQAQFDMARRRGFIRIWSRQKLKVGDLVFHKTTSARVGHAGIYIGGDRFISATSSGGVRVKSLYDPYYWGPRWVGATRTPVTIRNR